MKQALPAFLLGTILAVTPTHLGRGEVKDHRALVKQARAAYYNLPRLGVSGYRCQVVTDWRTMVSNLADPEKLKSPEGQQALKFLESIHIWMTVDKSGDPKFTKELDEAGTGASIKEQALLLLQKQESILTHKAHELRTQLITGMLPYPDDSYTLEENDGGYLISMTEGNLRGAIRMGRDFKIFDFTTSLPDGTVTITPQYLETAQGFLMTSRRVETRGNPHDSGTVTELLEYSDVGGLQIPTKITSVILLDRAPDKKPRRLILSFAGCQLQKRTD